MKVKDSESKEYEINKKITSRVSVRSFLLLLLIMTGVLVDEAALPENASSTVRPPPAKKVPKVDIVHGDRRVDNYFWLREKSNPEVAAYLNAENAYTDAVMKPTETLQEALYKEMLSHIKETDLSVPYREGGYFYYSRTEEAKQYPIYYRKKGKLEAAEEVTLDLNELAKGEKFMALGAYTVSDDGKFLAYATDNTGFRQYTLRVKDLESGRLLSERIEKTASVVWANDGRTLFYSVEDSAKRPYRLYRHRLGTMIDDLVYEEKDDCSGFSSLAHAARSTSLWAPSALRPPSGAICQQTNRRESGISSPRACMSMSTTWSITVSVFTSGQTRAETSAWSRPRSRIRERRIGRRSSSIGPT